MVKTRQSLARTRHPTRGDAPGPYRAVHVDGASFCRRAGLGLGCLRGRFGERRRRHVGDREQPIERERQRGVRWCGQARDDGAHSGVGAELPGGRSHRRRRTGGRGHRPRHRRHLRGRVELVPRRHRRGHRGADDPGDELLRGSRGRRDRRVLPGGRALLDERVRNTYQRVDRTLPMLEAGETYEQTREFVGGDGTPLMCPSTIPVQSFLIE